jgi:hypothetical protein
MKRMKMVKILAILMAMATVLYIGIEVYGYNNSHREYVLYAAELYEGEIPPPLWYTPEQLGIFEVIERENSTSVRIAVDIEREQLILREVHPIFQYKDKFYKVCCTIGGIAYSATLYEGEIPPPLWYTPEQLGAVEVADYRVENATNVWLVVPPGEEPFPLQEVQPIFKYKEKFYKVSPLWAGYPVPSNLPQQPIGAALCGIGWLATGILWLNWRKEDKATKSS